MTDDFEITVEELIRRLQEVPPGTLLGMFPRTAGGVSLRTLKPDPYGENEGDATIWDDLG